MIFQIELKILSPIIKKALPPKFSDFTDPWGRDLGVVKGDDGVGVVRSRLQVDQDETHVARRKCLLSKREHDAAVGLGVDHSAVDHAGQVDVARAGLGRDPRRFESEALDEVRIEEAAE